MNDRPKLQLSPAAIGAAANLKNGDSLVAYFEDHLPVGGFLTAVLSNDLGMAFAKADLGNRATMYDYAAWLYNYAPAYGPNADSWGSLEKVLKWAPGSG